MQYSSINLSPKSRPTDFTNLLRAKPWSPWPMMMISATYGICITVAAHVCDVSLRPIFRDFKVELPWPTTVAMELSRFIWSDYAWIGVMLICFLWPLLISVLPAPQLPESRRVIVRTLRLGVCLIFGFTGIAIAVAVFTPLIALLHSVTAK